MAMGYEQREHDKKNNRESAQLDMDRIDADRFHEVTGGPVVAEVVYKCLSCGWQGTEPRERNCKRLGVRWYWLECPECETELKEI